MAPSQSLTSMKLEDFGQLQARYQSMSLAVRARTVLEDAQPALETAQRILQQLPKQADCKKLFDRIRKNSMLMGKMRPSDARVALMDGSCDFLKETERKLATWRKTIERLSEGEAIVSEGGREYIPADAPLAMALAGSCGISNYVSIIQLALMELSRQDKDNAAVYACMTAEIRRCSTVLSDYENASSFHTLVH